MSRELVAATKLPLRRRGSALSHPRAVRAALLVLMLPACFGRGGFEPADAGQAPSKSPEPACLISDGCGDGEACVSTRCVPVSSIPPCDASVPESNCSNGLDDECDGASDCSDADCLGANCGPNARQCSASGQCTCVTGRTTELECGDGIDGDGDGDCADSDCEARSCGPTNEFCSSLQCSCASPGPESNCSDGIDDDCNGAANSESNCSNDEDDDCDGF